MKVNTEEHCLTSQAERYFSFSLPTALCFIKQMSTKNSSNL